MITSAAIFFCLPILIHFREVFHKTPEYLTYTKDIVVRNTTKKKADMIMP